MSLTCKLLICHRISQQSKKMEIQGNNGLVRAASNKEIGNKVIIQPHANTRPGNKYDRKNQNSNQSYKPQHTILATIS